MESNIKTEVCYDKDGNVIGRILNRIDYNSDWEKWCSSCKYVGESEFNTYSKCWKCILAKKDFPPSCYESQKVHPL